MAETDAEHAEDLREREVAALEEIAEQLKRLADRVQYPQRWWTSWSGTP